MKVTPGKLNTFTMMKLPSAWLCGIRVTFIDEHKCEVKVKHRWINQNPFNSMFWAVQGMAAELTTGAMMMTRIRNSGHKISMLVANNNATFTKKATGKITFVCDQGALIEEALQKTMATGEGQTVWMQSKGFDEKGDVVSVFNFEWTVKLKAS